MEVRGKLKEQILTCIMYHVSCIWAILGHYVYTVSSRWKLNLLLEQILTCTYVDNILRHYICMVKRVWYIQMVRLIWY